MRKRWWLGLGTLVVLAVAGWIVTTSPFGNSSSADSSAQQPESRGDTTTVQRGDLSVDAEFSGEITYGEPWVISAEAGGDGDEGEGIVTASHPAGTVVQPGGALIYVDNAPITLARGEMPMYRVLERTSDPMEGEDVAQLQQFLVDQGFDRDGALVVDGVFGWVTEQAVKDWQEANGLPDTGQVDRSQLLFLPHPVRIFTEVRVGDPFTELEVTGADPLVLVETSNRDRAALPPGSDVIVQLADGSALPGTVVSQEQVHNDDGQTLWRTTIELEDVDAVDAGVVTVLVTDSRASDVLIVPARALLALAEGGFAVEVVLPNGLTELRPVTVGEVVDGMAEIDGDVAVGDQLVVPS